MAVRRANGESDAALSPRAHGVGVGMGSHALSGWGRDCAVAGLGPMTLRRS